LTQEPSNARRMWRKSIEIVLARLGLGRWLGMLPFLRRGYTRLVMARRDHTGLYSGVYRSYAEAIADVPPTRLAGWDHEESANLWLNQIDPVRPSTYPVFFWLKHFYGENSALLDIGGSIGLTYYGYRRYCTMPANATWNVVEVPHIAARGAEIAQRECAVGLTFTSQIANVRHCDILLVAGALQFMENSVPGLLESLPNKPRHLLLNKLPITPQEDCWTLQNYGPAVTPNRLFNEDMFLAYFASHGYRVRDRWAVQDIDCLIPFYPQRFIREFTGFLFEIEEKQ
jgi:putative methyltransferase (TIGR04325 family)